jgi:hypothetical protein
MNGGDDPDGLLEWIRRLTERADLPSVLRRDRRRASAAAIDASASKMHGLKTA